MSSFIDSGWKILRKKNVMGAPCFIRSESEGAEVDMQRGPGRGCAKRAGGVSNVASLINDEPGVIVDCMWRGP